MDFIMFLINDMQTNPTSQCLLACSGIGLIGFLMSLYITREK